nr:uncharacterized protein LOC123773624 [Procambarus clarkii]
MLGVAQCSAARAARGARTWVAFVGDSNQRQKIHSFMSFLPPELTYTYFLGNKEVTQAEFTYAVAHHKHRPPTFDIVGKPRPNANSKTFTSPRDSATNPRASTVTTTNPRASTEKTTNLRASTEKTTNPRASTEKTTNPRASTEKTTNPKASTVKTANPRASTVTATNPRASTVKTTNPRASTNQITSTTMTTTTTSHGENLTNIHPNTELHLNSDNSDLVVQEDINYYPKKSNDTNTHINHVFVGNNDTLSFVEMENTGKNRTKEPYDFSYSEDDLLDDDPRLSSYELRVTLVWAPFGTWRDNYLDPHTRSRKVTKLEEWVKAEVIPDVIVTGFGSWMLMIRKDVDELVPFSELNKLGLQVAPIFANLAQRTRVLFLSQSRYRWFNFEGTKQLPNDPKAFWKTLLDMGQFRDALPLVDAWLWRILRSTGMWHWDSTLPFNLANIRECHMLWNNSALYEPLYTDSWWHCQDVHHASYETNHDEIQMLLNLLCNPYLTRARNYCCSVT